MRLHRDALLIGLTHPLGFMVASVARRAGDVVRVPGIGVLVSGGCAAREVLIDDERFVKRGPRSPAEIATAVLGTSALINMDGDDHHTLQRIVRRALDSMIDEIAPAVVDRTMGPFVTRLERGEVVDLCSLARSIQGGVAAAAIGIEERQQLRILEIADQIARLGSLHHRTPSRREIEKCRSTLSELIEPALERESFAPVSAALSRANYPRELWLSVSGTVLLATSTLGVGIPRVIRSMLDQHGSSGLCDATEPLVLQARISEALARVCPLPVTMRVATRDTSVAKKSIRCGERIIVVLHSAVRSEAARRAVFGLGPHRCTGEHVALEVIERVVRCLGEVSPLAVVRSWPAFGRALPAYARLEVRRRKGR